MHLIDILVNDSNRIDDFEKERVKLLTLTAFDLDNINEIVCEADLISGLLQEIYQEGLEGVLYRNQFLDKLFNHRKSFIHINELYC